MLSLSLSLSQKTNARRERERVSSERKRLSEMRNVLPMMFQRAALLSLSLSLVLCLYKFEEETAPLFWGKVFRYLSLCVFK